MSGVINTLLSLKAASAAGLLLDSYTLGLTAAYSTRKLLTAYAGSAMRVARSSDSAELDIGFSGNDLDTTALLAHVGAGDGSVVTLYDQSGNGINFIAATPPQIVVGGVLQTLNSNPSINFASSQRMTSTATTANLATASAWTALVGANPTSIVLAADSPGYDSGTILSTSNTYWNPLGVGTYSAATKFSTANYTSGDIIAVKPTTLSSAFVGIGSLGSGTLSAYVNGGTPGTTASGDIGNLTGTLVLGRTSSSTSNYAGYLSELIFYNTALSTAAMNAIGADVAARVGATWSTV